VPDTIEAYLAELRAALAGADPALVQDAVYDAEDYLRTAAAEGGGSAEAVSSAIDAYGTPTEIADAYRRTEVTVSAALKRPAATKSANRLVRFFGIVADPGAWGALFYMFMSLVTGILYFVTAVVGFSVSTGLMVLIIGIPMALLFISAVRGISFAEGRIVEALLGQRMPRRPRLATTGPNGSFIERLKAWLLDYRTWTTMLYMVLMLPLGITYFTLVVTALALSFGAFVAPIAQWIANTPVIRFGEWGLLIDPWEAPLWFAAGILGAFVTLWLAKGVGYLHGMFAKTMLVGRFEGGAQ
jgi:uncharacterized membrane protein